MVGGEAALGFDAGAEVVHEGGGFNGVEVGDVFEAGPHGGDGVGVGVGFPGAEFASEYGGFAGGVDEPGGGDGTFFAVGGFEGEGVVADAAEGDVFDGGGACEFAAEFGGLVEEVGIEFDAVELEGGEAALEGGSHFGGVAGHVVVFPVIPHAEAMFGDVFA